MFIDSDDNDQNLNLAEGERSKKLTELEKTIEQRFDESDRGANKVRGKDPIQKSKKHIVVRNEIRTVWSSRR